MLSSFVHGLLKKCLLTALITSSTTISLEKSALGATIFIENFTSTDTVFYSSGVFYNNWNVQRSTGDGGARISNNALVLTNDASSTANSNGQVWAYYATSNFGSPYNSILSSNLGAVSWSFNMQQIRSDPSGFASSNYGVAFILGASSTNFQAASGYAVVLGQSGSTDSLRLVRFANGLVASTNIISDASSDFGSEYLSIKVTYQPSTNTWSLFARNDGNTNFSDPSTVNTKLGIDTVDGTYTANSLPYIGGVWNYATAANQTAQFDSLTVSVEDAAEVPFEFSPINGMLILVGLKVSHYYLRRKQKKQKMSAD